LRALDIGALATAASVTLFVEGMSAAATLEDIDFRSRGMIDKKANPASAAPQKTTQATGHAILRRCKVAVVGSGLSMGMGPIVPEQSRSLTLGNERPTDLCGTAPVELPAGVCTVGISGSHRSETSGGDAIAARISPTDRPEESSSSIDLIVLS
jgi:hypothetical protein